MKEADEGKFQMQLRHWLWRLALTLNLGNCRMKVNLIELNLVI